MFNCSGNDWFVCNALTFRIYAKYGITDDLGTRCNANVGLDRIVTITCYECSNSRTVVVWFWGCSLGQLNLFDLWSWTRSPSESRMRMVNASVHNGHLDPTSIESLCVHLPSACQVDRQRHSKPYESIPASIFIVTHGRKACTIMIEVDRVG
jgi:hypothetical protein